MAWQRPLPPGGALPFYDYRRRLFEADAAARTAIASHLASEDLRMQRNRVDGSPRANRLAATNSSPRRASRSGSVDTPSSLPSVSYRSRSSTCGVDVEEVKQQEDEAKQRVASLRARLARAERLEREANVEEARKKRREHAMAVRTEEELLVDKLESVKPLKYAEGQLLETLFNERLCARYHEATHLNVDEDSAIRWLCSKIDKHQDKTVSLLPYTRMVREVLGLTETEVPQKQVLGLWLTSLKPIPMPSSDAKSALEPPLAKPPVAVTMRELQQYFKRGGNGNCRKGEAEQAAGRRERLASENRAVVASVKADLAHRIRAPLDVSVSGVASPAEVRALAELMNQQMATLFAPNERTFYRLFKYMDNDGSEMIEFDEFESMVRKELRLGPKELPFERLLSLWRAIDADGSGRVCQGEFGRFMRYGSADRCDPDSWIKPDAEGSTVLPRTTPRRTRISQGGNPMADAQALLRARRAQQRDEQRADSQGDVARRVKQSARGLDMEAQRLEARIAEKERSARERQRR